MVWENLACSAQRTEDEGWWKVVINGYIEEETGLFLQIFLLALHNFPVEEAVREMQTKYYEKKSPPYRVISIGPTFSKVLDQMTSTYFLQS